MSDTNSTIGIFDSGVGGLSVMKVLSDFLPNESYTYFADSLNAPYGNKSMDFITERSFKITDFLIKNNAKLIVVACNTATSASIDKLRNKYPDIPFVGMEPAVKPASLLTKTGEIGVLATNATFNGQLFNENKKKYEAYINIHYAEGKGLVELAEKGKINSKESSDLLKSYIKPMMEKNVDQLVLGCTHYPLFIPQIKKITGDRINIIDPADAIAKRTKDLLIHFRLLNTLKSKRKSEILTNGNQAVIKNMIKLLNTNIDISFLPLNVKYISIY